MAKIRMGKAGDGLVLSVILLALSPSQAVNAQGVAQNQPVHEDATANLADNVSGELKITYATKEEKGNTYTGVITLENPYNKYVWNGNYFSIWDFSFVTTSKINSTTVNNGGVKMSQADGRILFDLGWLSIFPPGKKIEVTITATKEGDKPFPMDFKPNYVRADDIIYPEYAGLPASWAKNKPDLKVADLIANPADYYSTPVTPVKDKVIIYKPYHPTQIWIGECRKIKGKVNETPGIRVWVPSRFMGMGLGFVFEMFKMNPNFMAALGTKENFACGIVDSSTGIDNGHKIYIDGHLYYWPFVAMADGPFQQESQNFNDCKANYPDYLKASANHPAFCQTTTSKDDPAFVSSAITAGISMVVTREHLYAVKGVNYNEFMSKAKDPWSEFVVIDYGFNMGPYEIFKCKMFGSRRQEALKADRVDLAMDLVGDSGHVQEVRGLLDEINNETQFIYDEKVSWEDMEKFFTRLRMFYDQGVPVEEEWTAMKADAKRAFALLAEHWGGKAISIRYDFLTMLRVIKQYLPKPYTPRPAGENWYYIITGQKLP